MVDWKTTPFKKLQKSKKINFKLTANFSSFLLCVIKEKYTKDNLPTYVMYYKENNRKKFEKLEKFWIPRRALNFFNLSFPKAEHENCINMKYLSKNNLLLCSAQLLGGYCYWWNRTFNLLNHSCILILIVQIGGGFFLVYYLWII